MGIQKLFSVIRDLAPDAFSDKSIDSLQGKRLAIDAHIFLYEIMATAPFFNGQHVIGMLRMAHWLKRRKIEPIFVFDSQNARPESKKALLGFRRERKREFINSSATISDTIDLLKKLHHLLTRVKTVVNFSAPLLFAGSDRHADIRSLHMFLEESLGCFLPGCIVANFFAQNVEPVLSFAVQSTTHDGILLADFFGGLALPLPGANRWLQKEITGNDWTNARFTAFLVHLRNNLKKKMLFIDAEMQQSSVLESEDDILLKSELNHSICGSNFTFLVLRSATLPLIASDENKEIVNQMWRTIYHFRKQVSSNRLKEKTDRHCSITECEFLLPVLLYHNDNAAAAANHTLSRKIVAPMHATVADFETQMHLQCLLCVGEFENTNNETASITCDKFETDKEEPCSQTIRNPVQMQNEEALSGALHQIIGLDVSLDSTVAKSSSDSFSPRRFSSMTDCSAALNSASNLFIYPEVEADLAQTIDGERNICIWGTMQQLCCHRRPDETAVHGNLHSAIENRIKKQLVQNGVANIDYAAQQYLCRRAERAESTINAPLRILALENASLFAEKRVYPLLETFSQQFNDQTLILRQLYEMQKNVLKQTVRVGFDEINQVKTALLAFGVSIVEAEHEAEAACVQICMRGQADYVVTDDSDAIPFGATLLLRNFKMRDGALPYETCAEQIDCSLLKQRLNLSHSQLIDWCVLCGCDFISTNGSTIAQQQQQQLQTRSAEKGNFPIQRAKNRQSISLLNLLKTKKAQEFYANNSHENKSTSKLDFLRDFAARELALPTDSVESLLRAQMFFRNNAFVDPIIGGSKNIIKTPDQVGSASERANALRALVWRLDCAQYADCFLNSESDDCLTRSSSLSPV